MISLLKMKLLHVTHNKNIGSIMRYGLLPSYIELDHHWDGFQKYLEDRYCIYLWNAETYENTKFIRDMIYTKMFIHPRNRMLNLREFELKKMGLDTYDEELYLDFKLMGGMLFGDSGSYSVLEIDSDDVEAHGDWQHVQEPHDDKYGTTVVMNDGFAHDNKFIYICENRIGFKNIKIVEEVLVRKYENNNLGFTFRKS